MDISLNLYLFLVINLFSKINSPFARKKFQLNCELRIKLHQAEIWLFQKHDIETQMKIIYSVPVLNWKKKHTSNSEYSGFIFLKTETPFGVWHKNTDLT